MLSCARVASRSIPFRAFAGMLSDKRAQQRLANRVHIVPLRSIAQRRHRPAVRNDQKRIGAQGFRVGDDLGETRHVPAGPADFRGCCAVHSGARRLLGLCSAESREDDRRGDRECS